MSTTITAGPLTARLRECWIDADNLRQSADVPGWRERTIHAFVVEYVEVDKTHRRQGRCRRFLAALCADESFEMVVVEAVQNAQLADFLMRDGWECDAEVMDFYQRRKMGD